MASKLHVIKTLLLLICGVLLTYVGFHVATWQYWAFALLIVAIALVSYYEGRCENGKV